MSFSAFARSMKLSLSVDRSPKTTEKEKQIFYEVANKWIQMKNGHLRGRYSEQIECYVIFTASEWRTKVSVIQSKLNNVSSHDLNTSVN